MFTDLQSEGLLDGDDGFHGAEVGVQRKLAPRWDDA